MIFNKTVKKYKNVVNGRLVGTFDKNELEGQ